MAYPAYYPRMPPINRAGAPVLGGVPGVAALDPDGVRGAVGRGATVVDARDRDAFAAAHLPGSVNIELNSGFGSYVGWVLPFDIPVVLPLPEPSTKTVVEAATQLLRIGWRTPAGFLAGGIDAWTDAGGATRSYPTATPADLCAAMTAGPEPVVLDVRQELEWGWGVLPGSRTVFVADLPGRLAEFSGPEPVWAICSNGHRAAVAASLLDGAGVPVRLVGSGGVGEVRQLCAQRRATAPA